MAMIMSGVFIPSIVSDEVYDPVFDTEMDANFIYQLLPSFYRTVMQDQDLFSVIWSSVMQSVAADGLNLWQIDYAKALKDVPLFGQRKWIFFDLYRLEEFEEDPGLNQTGRLDTFVYNFDEQYLEANVVNRARWDKATTPLRGFVNEASSLSWSMEITISSAQSYSGALFGYFGDRPRLSNSLVFAILGSQVEEDAPTAAILHFDPDGLGSVSIDGFSLSLDVLYRFHATYTALTGAVVLSVIEVRSLKLSGTGVTSSDILASPVTNQMVDETMNFDDEGIIAGDFLQAFGLEFEIISVDGSTLTVNPIGLPVGVDGFPYDIIGENEVTSLSMDLPGDAGNPTFTAREFGVSSLDVRNISELVFTAPRLARRKTLNYITDNWRFFDPTVDDIILSIPRMQDTAFDPTKVLDEGIDYRVERDKLLRFKNLTDIMGTIRVGALVTGRVSNAVGYVLDVQGDTLLVSPRLELDYSAGEPLFFQEGGLAGFTAEAVLGAALQIGATTSTIRFMEPQEEPLWAEYVAYDEEYIRSNFGTNVGLEETSSERYKARVRGLYYAYFQGPTVDAIRTGVHILIGLPIADKAGVVEAINPEYSGVLSTITVAGETYFYPSLAGTSLQVGDEVQLFDRLSDGVEVEDYIIDPEWFVNASTIHEIQKFHSFRVSLNLDAFDLNSFGEASRFVQEIKPTWKEAYFEVYKLLIDDWIVSDAFVYTVVLNLYDVPCSDIVLVSYDDAILGEDIADWKYDQGQVDWDETSGAMRGTSTALTGTVDLLNGNTTATGTGTDWITSIADGDPGPYPVSVSNKFLAVGLFTTGVSGVKEDGSPIFIDNDVGAFDALEALDFIDIAGEDRRRIVTVDRNEITSGTSAEFTAPTTLVDPTATFLSDGVQQGDVLAPSGGGLNDGEEFVVVSATQTTITFTGSADLTLLSTGAGDFTAATVIQDLGADFVADGVLSGDEVTISGGGPNDGSVFIVELVTPTAIVLVTAGIHPTVGETYSIKRPEAYSILRRNQLTLDAPLTADAIAVAWQAEGILRIWGTIDTVTSDTILDFATPFGGVDGTYHMALLDPLYMKPYYDWFMEACPDEEFVIRLTYTNLNGGGPYPGFTVPDAPFQSTTTFDFNNPGDQYTVTLDERTL